MCFFFPYLKSAYKNRSELEKKLSSELILGFEVVFLHFWRLIKDWSDKVIRVSFRFIDLTSSSIIL